MPLAKKATAIKKKLVVTVQERDSTKYEVSQAVEAFLKSGNFVQADEKICLAKLIKIYVDLVTQIWEVQSEF